MPFIMQNLKENSKTILRDMELKLKKEFLGITMISPFGFQEVELKFLDKGMYIHYYNAGHQYLFDIVEPQAVKEQPKKKKD